jgi:hypothetical protein
MLSRLEPLDMPRLDDIWEIRRAVIMKDLPSQDIDDWSFVFSRSRNR